MSSKQWRMKTGEVINIADMADSHLANTIAMLRRKGFVSNSDLSMYLCSEPNGEMAQELYFAELSRIKTHPALDELEAEQKRRRTSRAPDALRAYDMGEVAGVKLTYVNGNVFATPAKRR